ncbi:MAG: hypothetical protein DRJ01_06355 [Bacteroidetes bacterium]|nr:MAG: hypothetical protein DRJ01_06355 [Bacteroidota bacterium]
MINDRKNIDKLFHDVLINNEHEVPNYIWNNIKDNLLNKKRRRNRILLRNIAASVIIILTFASGYFFSDLFRLEKHKSLQSVIKKQNLKVKETDNNAKKININPDNKANKELDTKKQDNITFQNNNQNKGFLSKTETKSLEINKKKKEQVPQNKLLANSIENESFDKSMPYNDKIIYKKLKLINADNIDIDLNSEQELIYSLEQVPILNTDLKKKKESRWSVEGQFSPLYAYRDVKEVDAYYVATANTSNSNYRDNAKEEPLSAFSVGANVKYKVSERLRIQTGVYYSETGQITKNAMLFSESMYNGKGNTYLLNTSVGNVIEANNVPVPVNNVDNLDFSNSEISDIIQNFDYLEIPAIIKYKIIDRKIDVNILSGINTGFLVGNNVVVKNNTDKYNMGKTTDINTINYSVIIGVNFVYPLFKKFSFSIEPTFKYSLTSINKFNSVYPYSFAVFSGISFLFE